MKNFLIVFLTIFYFSCLKGQIDNPDITTDEIKKHITYLASDELKGRFSGSEELKEAAEYIVDEFKSYQLKPLFNQSYFQEFEITTGIKATENNKLILRINSEEFEAESGSDFIPLSFSGNIKKEAELVFAGYGISAPLLKYNDYENLDVKGKIVVVLRYNPEYGNPYSAFEEYSSFRYKASTAREKGAAGIIFFHGYFPDEPDKLIPLKSDKGGNLYDFPAIFVKRNFIEKIFNFQKIDLKEHQKKILELKQAASFQFKNVTAIIQTDIDKERKLTWNVGAILEGTDPKLKDEYIVIGAHFDHVGMGEYGSLHKGEPEIHNGADDNASGTTGILELAEKFSSEKNKIKRSLIFICFSGEELGLLGSNYFVNNSPVPIKNIAAMINLDMIGRMSDNRLILYGTGTSPIWMDLINKNNTAGFNINYKDEGFGPSDHSSFYAKKIPVLFFFTGTHQDYHRPTDDADKINLEDQKKILIMVYNLVSALDLKPEKPQYVSIPRKETGIVSDWTVYVGTIPDYSSEDQFKIMGVSEDSPADKAGLQGGDAIINFGGKEIKNIYDFMNSLKDFVPGDVVDVVILRNNEKRTLKVKLEAR